MHQLRSATDSFEDPDVISEGGPVIPEQLLLLGAGGFARETLELVRAINCAGVVWEIAGLLDDDPELHGRSIGGIPVLGPVEAVRDHPDALVAATVASPVDPTRRLRLVSRLDLAPERYATLVHPDTTVPDSVVIGYGSVLHARVVLTADIEIGTHVVVMPAVVLTHDDLIGDGVTFASGATLGGGVAIGDGAYLGAGAMIRENVTVGPAAVVGMGAVVTRDVPAGEVWVGVPAAPLHARDTAD